MSIKQKIINRALLNATAMLGTDYSRTARDKVWPGGAADCSSLIAACWGGAGFPLLSEAGAELRTSCYEINAVGFDLIYPDARAKIGKNLPSPKGLLSSYGAEPGDIVFMNFDSDTGRANKITHVAMIYNTTQLIHTANNREKCCFKPLDYGDKRICAIIRLRDDVKLLKLPNIKSPGENEARAEEWAVRALQAALNVQAGAALILDGICGPKTEAATQSFNALIGATGSTCTDTTWEALGFINNVAAVRDLFLIDKPRMSGEDVRELQERLVLMGYSIGSAGADGIYGPATDNAVRLLCERAGQLTPGRVDDPMRALLGLTGGAC
ncbi:MAG: peptidoglycan-binding protein [Eubacteriales bacterium]|nr:peptidoglycan-binding protein [Eubacteriales bacterium]